jgi:hypothetical protein
MNSTANNTNTAKYSAAISYWGTSWTVIDNTTNRVVDKFDTEEEAEGAAVDMNLGWELAKGGK